MNTKSQVVALRTAEIISRESADWLAKMDGGNMTKAERLALKHWLAQSPEHAIALKNHMSMWDEMTEVLNDSTPIAEKESTPVDYSSWFSGLLNWKPMALAMSVMLVVMFTGGVFNTNWQTGDVESAFYLTKVGDQQRFELSDGSTALLNTDSRIEIEFTGNKRIIRLQKGEALFDVAHDKERPFIVYAAGSAVRAVGTKFVVRLSSENILVTVTEGTVELSKRDNDAQTKAEGGLTQAEQDKELMLLDMGEQAEYVVADAAFKPITVDNNSVEDELSWLEGRLVFKEERLEDVINEINRYVDTNIMILTPELKDIPISGRFEIGETEALLEAIEITFDIDVSKNKNQIYLSKYSSS